MDKKKINIAKVMMVASKMLNIIEDVINEFGYDLDKIAINL